MAHKAGNNLVEDGRGIDLESIKTWLMNLLEVIEHLKSIEKAEELIAVEIPTVEFGLVDVYLKEKLDINSEVKFFDVDAIPNNLDIEINGVKYVNLFPLPMVQEMVEEYVASNDAKLTNSEIAQRLLDYRIKDA